MTRVRNPGFPLVVCPGHDHLVFFSLCHSHVSNFDLISVSTVNFADLLLIITHNGNQSKIRGWTDWHAERGSAALTHPAHGISFASGRKLTSIARFGIAAGGDDGRGVAGIVAEMDNQHISVALKVSFPSLP